VLFASDSKFDSGTGWPSSSEPAVADAVTPHRGSLSDLRRPPRSRLPRWPSAHRRPVLHQLLRVAPRAVRRSNLTARRDFGAAKEYSAVPASAMGRSPITANEPAP
jgi:hypothetical protein